MMCFSAEASFLTAILLTGIGYSCLKQCPARCYLPLACIPLGFAVQQTAEGILWLTLPSATDSLLTLWIMPAMLLFLLFAILIWPVWTPLALALAEDNSRRRQLLWLLTLAGVGWGYFFLVSRWHIPLAVTLQDHSVRYITELTPTDTYPYAAIILGAFFLSSQLKVKWIGMSIALTYPLAGYFYWYSFISVWCFSAAVCSSVLYWTLRDLARESRQEALLDEESKMTSQRF